MANVFGWYALQQSAPTNPLQIINYARIVNGVNSEVGHYSDTTDYGTPTGGTWVTTPISIGSEPLVSAIKSDLDYGMMASRANLVLLSANTSATLAPPLTNLLFFVGNQSGKTEWQMVIPINFGAGNYDQLQLSLLENAGTRGDNSGSYPVVLFDGNSGAFTYTGSASMTLVLSGTGEFRFGLRAESTLNQSSMFEMHCVVIPLPA